MKAECYLKTPVGMLCIEEESEAITAVYVDKECEEGVECKEPRTELLKRAKTQLEEYFNGMRRDFELPIRMRGTQFQQKVWNALCTIPYGETRSYGDIAKQIGNPKACRAVGGANNKNHILIVVPCHRVIGADGSLVGFGCGLEIKKYLLDMEKNFIK